MTEKKKTTTTRDALAATSAVLDTLEKHFCEVEDNQRAFIAIAALNAAIILLGGKPMGS